MLRLPTKPSPMAVPEAASYGADSKINMMALESSTDHYGGIQNLRLLAGRSRWECSRRLATLVIVA